MKKSTYTSFFTLLAFWIVASFAQAQQITTSIENGAKVYIRYKGTDGKYYYLNAGKDYGTRPVTAVHGLECTLETSTSGDGYQVYGGITANGNSRNATSNKPSAYWLTYHNNVFKWDKTGSTIVTFVSTNNNANPNEYYFKYGQDCIYYNNLGEIIGKKRKTDGNTKWEIVTKQQLIEEMKAATVENPVDATFFISDPGFTRNVANDIKNHWEVYNASTSVLVGSLNNIPYKKINNKDIAQIDAAKIKVGNTTILNHYLDLTQTNADGVTDDGKSGYMSSLGITNGDGSLYRVQQKLTGLPAGKYRLSVQGASTYTHSRTGGTCYLFASNNDGKVLESAAIYKGNGNNNFDVADYKTAYGYFTGAEGSKYSSSVEVEVLDDGVLIIGVKNDDKSAIANTFIDNFELYYLGPVVASPVDFNPEAVTGAYSSWIEVTSTSDDVLNHPEKYLFTIWNDATTLFGLVNGTDGYQGSGYKTMGCVSGVKEQSNIAKNLWEMYKTSEGKYVFINPTERGKMLQTETEDKYFRFNDATVPNVSSASVTLTSADYNNWTFQTPKGYLRRWRSTSPDVVVDDKVGYLKLYAIPREEYIIKSALQQVEDNVAACKNTAMDLLSVERSFDASLMLANPDASETVGWTSTNVTTTKDGDSYFNFPSGKSSKLQQTLTNMPKGIYTLTVTAINGVNTASLFIDDAKTTITGAGTYSVTKEFTTDGCEFTFGVDVTGSPSSALQVNHFCLDYSAPIDINVYIRNNAGTENAPDYHYFNSSKTDGASAVLSKHGMEFTLKNNGTLSALAGFEGLQPFTLLSTQKTSGNAIGHLAVNGDNLLCNGESVNSILFKPIDLNSNPNAFHMYSVDKSMYVSGDNTLYNKVSFSDSPYGFEILTKDELISGLSIANPEEPVDATFFIDDPDFSKGSTKKSSWKVSNGTTTYDLDGAEKVFVDANNNKTTIQNYGDNNNFVRIVVYTGPTDTYYVQQTLTGLPKGYYRLSAQGIGRLSARNNAVGAVSMYLFAKNGEGTEKSEKFDEYNYFTASSGASVIEDSLKKYDYENYKKTIEVYVGDDGILTIGAKTGNKVNAAFIVDNFELYYLGDGVEYEFNSYPKNFDVTLMNNMIEVTESSGILDNPQDYLFTIWESSSSCLQLANGTDNNQGSGYKTMSFVSNPNLTAKPACFWELDKTVDGKYVFVNITDREHMMQTEDGTTFFRYDDATVLDVAKASVTIERAAKSNWVISTPQGYLHRLDNSCADVTIDNSKKGYHKIYAIPRQYYVMDIQRAKYIASKYAPQDVSLLLSNPDGAGTSRSVTTGIPAWDASVSGNFFADNSNNYDAINGKSYFVYWGNGTSKLSQTLSNLLKGKYIISVDADPLYASNGSLYVLNQTTNVSTSVPLTQLNGKTVELEFEVENDGDDITYGIDCTGGSPIKFDNFRLTYYGDESTLYVEPLIAGEEYYIRKNIGTDAQPEYRYLESGGTKYGTAAVFADHGIDYTFVSTGTSSNGYPVYHLDSKIGKNQASQANKENHYLSSEGLYNDKQPGDSKWYFVPRGVDYPFQYVIYSVSKGQNISYNPSNEYDGYGPNLKFTSSEEYFEIVPKYQRIRELENATKNNPVDATFLIKDPNFSQYDRRKSAWKIGPDADDVLPQEDEDVKVINGFKIQNPDPGFGKVRNNNVIVDNTETSDGDTSFDVYQIIKDVPNGHYKIIASGITTQTNGLWMYASDGESYLEQTSFNDNYGSNKALSNVIDAYNNFFKDATIGAYRKYVEVDITNNTLVIGFRGEERNTKAFFDNVELYFYGEVTPVYTPATTWSGTPASMQTPWVEVTATTDAALQNPDDYLFAIWGGKVENDKFNCLALAPGTNEYQGSRFKTMSYTTLTKTDSPINELSQLWEFYKESDGKYVIVNASSRERMMLADEASPYFRFGDETKQRIEKAVVELERYTEKNSNYNNWQIKSATINGRYLGRWSNSIADVKMVKKQEAGFYKIYAIKRTDYYTKKYNILYTANIMTPTDVSLLLKNPDAMGELDTFKHFGWNINTENEISVSDTVEHKFAALDGKVYFEYRNSEQPKTKMSQTIKNVTRGYYLLGVSSTCAGSNAILYVACNNDTINEELSAADPITHVVYVPIYVEKDGSSIDVGIDLTNYTHKKNSEDDDDTNASYIVKFDHFTLQYMGVSEVLASALADGTYFIRTNKNYGTDMSPEYMYLEAGGNKWGTDPILSKHGFAMELTKLNDGKYSIKNPLYQSNGGHGSMFDGLHFDHAVSQFTFQKVNPNDEESYEYWMYSHKASTNISGSEQTGLKGYMIKDNDNSLSLLDVSSAPTGEESAIWEIVTKTQRIKELQDATYENPMDATFFITDPSFGRNNTGKTSWQFNGNSLPITLGNNDHNSNNKDYGNFNISIGSENPSGDTKSNKYDYNVKVRGLSNTKTAYNLTQKVNIDNLPAGLYRLSVHGYTNADGGAILYAANEYGDLELCELNKVNGYADAKETDNKIKEHRYAAYWFTGNKTMAEIDNLSTDALNAHKPGEFKKEIEFKILSNTIIIGVRGELESGEFAMIDNFELYYLGEAAQDLSKLSEPVERYIYNVDAGKYLNDENGLSQLKQLGKKYYIEPVAGKPDRFYIYTKDNNDIKRYIKPNDNNDISYVVPNSLTAYEWIIKKASTSAEHNYIYEISDVNGRVFESTGDAKNYAYIGFGDDKEPRCTRWSFYEAGQYQKDRVFTTLASATRTNMWRVLRAAKVNHRDLSGEYAVAGLEEAMDKLDAVWTSPMASKLILEQKASDMKNLMIASMTTRGSEKMPLDVSFYIQNAGLGDKIGWTKYDAWLTWAGVSVGTNTSERMASIAEFLYQDKSRNVTLSQVVKNVPAGKYKLAVDLRARKDDTGYRLFMSADGADPVELSVNNYNNRILNTFVTEHYIELDKTQDLTIGIQQTSGSIAFDNFKLYFCGNVSGKLKLNSDSTELTVYGDWDKFEDLSTSVKDVISKAKEKLGTIYAYKDNFILSENLNVTEEGWQGKDGSRNNILFYTDYDGVYDANDGDKSNYIVTGSSNIVRKNPDGTYSCNNLVITDRMTMHVPYEFTAANVSYSRDNKISTGTLCLPFDLTKLPTGINKFYKPESIDWDANPSFGKLIISEYKSNSGSVLPANTPVLYDGVANGTISVNENNSLIHKTSELQTPKPENDDLTMYGTYQYKYVIGKTGVAVDGTKNSDGLSADVCYYVKTDNNSLVRGNHWFNIGAFRAFVYRGKGELNNVRPSVLYVDFDNVFDAVNEIAVDDAVVVGYYDVQGVCYDKPQNGLNIVLYSDGTRRKIYVK